MVRLLDIAVSSISCFEKPVFGISLSVAVERNKCHDGIQLPVLFRECVDYIEEHGKISIVHTGIQLTSLFCGLIAQ